MFVRAVKRRSFGVLHQQQRQIVRHFAAAVVEGDERLLCLAQGLIDVKIALHESPDPFLSVDPSLGIGQIGNPVRKQSKRIAPVKFNVAVVVVGILVPVADRLSLGKAGEHLSALPAVEHWLIVTGIAVGQPVELAVDDDREDRDVSGKQILLRPDLMSALADGLKEDGLFLLNEVVSYYSL